MMHGSCRLGLWYINVFWDDTIVHSIRFQRTGMTGSVPVEITRYLSGKTKTLYPLKSILSSREGKYGDIYRAVESIPFGEVRTYGEIARGVKTSPRIVGLAMMRNSTPLLIPCHRVVSAHDIGGFTPDIWIKEELLRIECTKIHKQMMIHPGEQEMEE